MALEIVKQSLHSEHSLKSSPLRPNRHPEHQDIDYGTMQSTGYRYHRQSLVDAALMAAFAGTYYVVIVPIERVCQLSSRLFSSDKHNETE